MYEVHMNYFLGTEIQTKCFFKKKYEFNLENLSFLSNLSKTIKQIKLSDHIAIQL